MKNIFTCFVFLGSLLGICASHVNAGPIKVVATQTIFADLVKQIGQDNVEVKAIASPKYNVHFIQPRPSDVRAVANADLYVNAGLDLEAWSDPLLEAAGQPALFRKAQRNVDLSRGIKLLNAPKNIPSRSEGDIHLFGNPHFHMSPENAKIMAQTIVEKLSEIDPTNAPVYEKNLQVFLTKLNEKIAKWKKMCLHCIGKEILSYHDDIAYLTDFLGIKAEQFLEPKPGISPTPKHLAFLEAYIQDHDVRAIVLPTYYSQTEAEKLARKMDTQVVVVAQNAGEVPGTDDFFSFFDYNVRQISETLK